MNTTSDRCCIMLLIIFMAAISLASPAFIDGTPREIVTDVCVYSATPAGILAAIAVQREGRSVVIVEPSRWVGGILGSGLKPMQDCPNPDAVGGFTATLLRILGTGPFSLQYSPSEILQLAKNGIIGPREVRKDYQKLIQENGLQIEYEHRIAGCDRSDRRILRGIFDFAPFDTLGCPPATATTPEDLKVTAKVFIDASYEGEFMARAGVSYRTGRESAGEFSEENAGVCEPMLVTPISPFVIPDVPGSGLLPMVDEDHGKPVGAADFYTQAYNFRFYVTADPQRRVEITPPVDYDPRQYELLGRYIAHLTEHTQDQELLYTQMRHIFPGWRNLQEYNYYRELLFTMAPVGISQLYADGDYATKARIWKQHQDYLRGLHYFMRTDSRVPPAIREETAALGLDGWHHSDTRGWPHQLYVRVSRRLKGRYTLTAHDVYNKGQVEDAIGLAQYGIDVYPARRIWLYRNDRAYVALEGSMFIGRSSGPTKTPYPIPYRAITPEKSECTNLLVPVCFSATHLGYASARMEPVFQICGESAGVAAVQAINSKVAIQDIDITVFQTRLMAFGQKLKWPTQDR